MIPLFMIMPRTPINSPKYLRFTSRIASLEGRVKRLESTLERGLELLQYSTLTL